MWNRGALMAPGQRGIPFLLLPTDSKKRSNQEGKTMEFLIIPKWQHGMEKGSTWSLTGTWRCASEP